MKQNFFLLLSISVILFSGCKKDNGGDMIWDISPVVVTVSAVDAKGNDLLDPQTPNAFDPSKIKAVFRGQEYECDKDVIDIKTKLYKPHFYGLQSNKNVYYGVTILSFGELDGAASYKDESVTIVWPDGSSDKISFNRDFEWKSNGEPASKEEWFLNGSKVSGGIININK